MVKNSKKLLKKAAKLEKRRKKQRVLPEFANSPRNIEEPSEHWTVFSFQNYRHDRCELCGLNERNANKVTTVLQRASKTRIKHLLKAPMSGLDIKKIDNSGPYTFLFDQLPDDAGSLWEIIYTREGRIFGFFRQHVFNIVLVAVNHIKLSEQN